MNPCTSKSIASSQKRAKRKRTSTPPKVKEMIESLGLNSSSSFGNNHSTSHNHSNSHNHSKCPSDSYIESLRLTPEVVPKKTRKFKNYKFVKTSESINYIDAYVRTDFFLQSVFHLFYTF